MSLIDTLRGRGTRSDPALDQTSPAQRAAVTTDLAERRGELARQLAILQFDLGGLAYEMARRDHFRLDVIVRQAAKLQEVDAELGEVERLLRLDEAAAGGSCSACGALHARGAGFCWQCGTVLVAEAQVNGTVAAP
jgi:hypothetical protein